MELLTIKRRTDYSSPGKIGRNYLRLRWKKILARLKSLRLSSSHVNDELKRLAKCLLRLVMLVTVPFVKPVGPLAHHVRSHIHSSAATSPGPLLSGFQQLRSRSHATLPLRNDQPIHFGPDIAFQ